MWWILKFAAIWHCIVGWVVLISIKDCIAFIFRVWRSLKMSGSTHAVTHFCIPENLNLSNVAVRTSNLALYLMFMQTLFDIHVWKQMPYRNQGILFTFIALQEIFTCITTLIRILFYCRLKTYIESIICAFGSLIHWTAAVCVLQNCAWYWQNTGGGERKCFLKWRVDSPLHIWWEELKLTWCGTQ